MQRIHLTQGGTGVFLIDLTYGIAFNGSCLSVFHQHRAKGQREAYVVFVHELLCLLLTFQIAPIGKQEIAVFVDEAGIELLSFKALHLSVVDYNAVPPEFVKISRSGHHRIDAGSHFGRHILLIRAKFPTGQKAAELGWMRRLDL